jgi:hypothetical protein
LGKSGESAYNNNAHKSINKCCHYYIPNPKYPILFSLSFSHYFNFYFFIFFNFIYFVFLIIYFNDKKYLIQVFLVKVINNKGIQIPKVSEYSITLTLSTLAGFWHPRCLILFIFYFILFLKFSFTLGSKNNNYFFLQFWYYTK